MRPLNRWISIVILMAGANALAAEAVPVDCSIEDRSVAPPAPKPEVAVNKPAVSNSEAAAVSNPAAPSGDESNKLAGNSKESVPPTPKLTFKENTPIDYKLKDTRYYVEIAHYTGTYAIMLFDRVRRTLLVKTTVPEQSFTGLSLETLKPQLKVDCPAKADSRAP